MKSIDVNELKQIQLDILKYVDSFCKENNIKYFLAYGTLLGAVRHKGYIPWDDDIDIVMLREDYDRFVHSFNNREQDKHYRVHSYELDETYPYSFAKVGDMRTYFEEEIRYSVDTGVNIDVFPLDYIPEDEKVQKTVMRKRKVLMRIADMKRLPLLKRRGLVKNIILAVCHIITFPISMRKIVMLLDHNAQQFNLKYSPNCCDIAYGSQKPYLTEAFSKVKELQFEDGVYPCPIDSHHVLSKMYGDYMKLPPKEKQVSHHHFIAYWK